jgi:hypothetical protein
MTCDKSCANCPQINGSVWLLPILLGALGGIIMYLTTKDINYQVSRKGLLVGLYLSFVPIAIMGAIALTMMNSIIGLLALAPLAATAIYQLKSHPLPIQLPRLVW